MAMKGESSDGLDFIPQAVERGAVVILSDRPAPAGLTLPFVQISGNPASALAHLAAALHGFPARQLRMIGVTGTDGKTTTTNLIHHILKAAEISAGMISTVSAKIGDAEVDTGFHVTTPDAPEVQKYLAEMVEKGMTHCVLEATSHALAQGRVTACDFDLAVITNVTHEHLDYHGTYENYLAAKGTLFESLNSTPSKPIGNLRLAVLNKDDRSYAYLKRVSPPNQVSYSALNEATLRADHIENTADGMHFSCQINDQVYEVQTPLIGLYNISNCLAALGACIFGLKVPANIAIAALADAPQVPGRMEPVEMGQDFKAIVDFAHTPNGLTRALETARSLANGGRVIVVFGSAGLRDREKRKMMPKIAVSMADLVILTAEDPRTEPLAQILEDMASAAAEAGGREQQTFWRVADRAEAIRMAVNFAHPGDLVIVCGKGHEQSMCFGRIEYPWDDRIAMHAALAERLHLPGPAMPVLPTQGQAASDRNGFS